MVGVTVAVFVAFLVVAMLVRPGAAVGYVVMSTLLWPEYLRVPIGIAQMSVPRLVAVMLLLRLISLGRHKRIKFNIVDILILATWLWSLFAIAVSSSNPANLVEIIGEGFDSVLMYFLARLALLSIKDAKDIIVPLLLTALIMGTLGIIEAVTSFAPYRELEKYRTWAAGFSTNINEKRLGLLRAKASTSVHIFFGMAMMLLTSMLWSLRSLTKSKKLLLFSTGIGILGALSSMSSGPWLAVMVIFFCNAYALKPKLIKPTLWAMLGVVLFLEIASNRHFYHLVSYFTLDPSNAWYRARLIEVVFMFWQEYWLVGVGDNSIDHWTQYLDGRDHVDLVNHFLGVAVRTGFIGMFFYIATHFYAIQRGVRAWRKSRDPIARSILFSLISTLVALDVASLSVGLFGPTRIYSFIILGMLVNAGNLWEPLLRRQRNVTKLAQ